MRFALVVRGGPARPEAWPFPRALRVGMGLAEAAPAGDRRWARPWPRRGLVRARVDRRGQPVLWQPAGPRKPRGAPDPGAPESRARGTVEVAEPRNASAVGSRLVRGCDGPAAARARTAHSGGGARSRGSQSSWPLTAQGYAGFGRFALPAGAVTCVLGGAGIARLRELAPPWRGALAVGAALLVCIPFATPRAERLDDATEVAARPDSLEDQFPGVIAALGGRSHVLACGRMTVDGPFRPALAWRLGVPVRRLALTRRPLLVIRLHRRVLQGFEGPQRLRRLAPVGRGRLIARRGGWDVMLTTRPTRCRSVPGRSRAVRGASSTEGGLARKRPVLQLTLACRWRVSCAAAGRVPLSRRRGWSNSSHERVREPRLRL